MTMRAGFAMTWVRRVVVGPEVTVEADEEVEELACSELEVEPAAPAGTVDVSTTEVVVTGAHVTAWPWLAAVAGTAIAAAGLVALARGRTWSARGPEPDRTAGTGGSDPEGGLQAEARPDPMAAWEALDRGEDPTTHPGSRGDTAGGEQ